MPGSHLVGQLSVIDRDAGPVTGHEIRSEGDLFARAQGYGAGLARVRRMVRTASRDRGLLQHPDARDMPAEFEFAGAHIHRYGLLAQFR